MKSLFDDIRMEFSDTNNELEKEVGGYEHVAVLRDIRVVDDDAVVVLKNLPKGTFPGDCILIQLIMGILGIPFCSSLCSSSCF